MKRLIVLAFAALLSACAQMALMDRPDTAHPFFWAAFTLIGDSGSPATKPLSVMRDDYTIAWVAGGWAWTERPTGAPAIRPIRKTGGRGVPSW